MQEIYWEWFCSITGLYRMQQEVLLHFFCTPEGVYRASEKELLHLREKGFSAAGKVQSFREKNPPEKTVYENRKKGIYFLSHGHEAYPMRLRRIEDEPYGLFYRGNLPNEEKKSVAIVGARMCTHMGKEIAQKIAMEVAHAGGSIVSGAAYGIDGAAQWAAIEAGGKSFAVLGCGVDICYPASHRQLLERLGVSGGVISEFPPGTRPLRHHFPIRNRIISALSDVVAVIEARKRSGSLITAEFAASQGRSVYAVPGRPWDELSEGCNELISQGAAPILSVDSFISLNFPDYKKKKLKLSEDFTLAPAEKLVYSSLGLQSKTLWELEECTVLSVAELSGALFSLEEKGLIRETQRGCYMRT